MKQLFPVAAALLLLATIANPISHCHAQGTAFTYQGRLNIGTNVATGSYDLRFALLDAVTAGAQQGNLLTNSATAVSNGLFTVTLDFGNQFPGAARWLEMAVRTNGLTTFTNLAPRQPLTPTPYAVYAGSANATHLVGTVPTANLSGVALLNGGNAFIGNQSFSGSPFNVKIGLDTTTPITQLANTDVNIFGTDGFGLGNTALGWRSSGLGYVAGFYNSFSTGGASDGVVIGIADSASRILDLNLAGSSVMVVNGNGRVGIGTATPKHKLDVNGNIFLGTVFNGLDFTEIGDTLSLGASLKYLSSTLGAPVAGSPDWINLMCHPLSMGIMFGAAGPSDADPHSAPNPLMVIRSNGNVGIGTTTPSSRLTVNSSGSPAISLIGSGTDGQVDIGIAGFATAYSDSAVANDAVIRQSGKGKLFLQTGSGAAAIAITTDNNVGIGTATPNSDSRLQVNGMVRLGSETGTSEAPNRSILVRRVHSTSSATGQVVARGLNVTGNIMTLERDGSNGGLILKLTGSNAAGAPQISGYGITASGTFVGVNMFALPNNSSTQIFTDAQRICNCRLSFGEPYNDSDMTTVELMRGVDVSAYNDNFWAGTVTSTVNQ